MVSRKDAKAHRWRDRVLQQFRRYSGPVEIGFRVEACLEPGAPAPIIDYKPNDLWIEFPFSPEYLEIIRGEATGKTTQVTPQVTALLAALHGEMNREQLQKALHLSARKNFRLLYLVPSLEAGLIEYTLPEKPNSRLQKYRLTANGRAWLSRNQP